LLAENPATESVESPPAPDPVEAPAAQGPALLQTAAAAPTVVPEVPAPHDPPLTEEAKEEVETDQSAAPADETAEKEEEEKEEEPPRARPVTILVAVSIGLIATIASIAYIVWDQMNSFSGADQVIELLNSANALTGDEFEAVNTTTSKLKDWFFLKSDMHWFAVPKELADTPTVGCRAFKFKGADIGQILANDDKEVLMFLFHPADLGVKMRRGKWVIVDGENWVGDVTAVDDCCFMVAFKGKHSDMQVYQDKKLKK
jgi:hypothetical protein